MDLAVPDEQNLPMDKPNTFNTNLVVASAQRSHDPVLSNSELTLTAPALSTKVSASMSLTLIGKNS
jgi:hypothetical protein